MKKSCCIAALALSLLLGVARTADLVWNTDAATGFLQSGSVLARYALLLPVPLLASLAGHAVPRRQPCGLRPGWLPSSGGQPGGARPDAPPAGERAPGARWMNGVNPLLAPLAFCSELYGFLALLQLFYGVTPPSSSHHATDNPLLTAVQQTADGVRAALFVVFGVWCLLLFFENRTCSRFGKWMLPLGVAGSAAFYLHTVLRFVERPSSLHRILPAIEILSALTALQFVTALLRALYLPGSAGAARALCRSGLLAFFFCTCLALPQAVWQSARESAPAVSCALAACLGCVGLVGAICAWRVSARRRAPSRRLPDKAPNV